MSAAADPFAAFAAAFGPALTQAAGAEGRAAVPVSLTLDLAGSPSTDPAPVVRAWVERATRTLVFMSAEARDAEGRLLAAAAAVYRVPGADAPA